MIKAICEWENLYVIKGLENAKIFIKNQFNFLVLQNIVARQNLF